MTYIIGDVHGEYDTLLALVDKLPDDAELIFVGDLVDRGTKSKEVIKFVRENNYQCCMGNHEELMIQYGTSFIKTYPNPPAIGFLHMWLNNGGKQALLSYDIIEIINGKVECKENENGFKQFKDDIEWLKTLPLYIKIPKIKKDGKKIIISHASCGNVWHHHDNPDGQETFREYALWNRNLPYENCEIFNIFGHTMVEEVELNKHYINVDTGCCNTKEVGYARLSAYCIETGKVVTQRRIYKND